MDYSMSSDALSTIQRMLVNITHKREGKLKQEEKIKGLVS